jgi:hypothetical protein
MIRIEMPPTGCVLVRTSKVLLVLSRHDFITARKRSKRWRRQQALQRR